MCFLYSLFFFQTNKEQQIYAKVNKTKQNGHFMKIFVLNSQNAGTSACACALSASFDSLSGGAIGRSIAGAIGTIFGELILSVAHLKHFY